MIRIGVGGWVFKPWRGRFYPSDLPQKDELSFMARQFDTTEVNATFYRTPSAETFGHWHDAVPERFRFALKAPRYATNRRDLGAAEESVQRFLSAGITRLGPKLGPINWQLAPTKAFDLEEFGRFLSLLPQRQDGLDLHHAVEPRHDSFACPEAAEMCRTHGVSLVCAADGPYPMLTGPTSGPAYLRLMGTQSRFKAGYAPKALDRWAERIRDWPCGAGKDVYVFVISGAKEANPDAALALRARLAG